MVELMVFSGCLILLEYKAYYMLLCFSFHYFFGGKDFVNMDFRICKLLTHGESQYHIETDLIETFRKTVESI